MGVPASTLIVNLLGSLIAGIFLNKFTGTSYFLIYIGVLGSFTTLSSFNIELFNPEAKPYSFRPVDEDEYETQSDLQPCYN